MEDSNQANLDQSRVNHGDSWRDIDQLLEDLERSRERERERLERHIEQIEQELEHISDVYTENVSSLEEKIRKQKNRLETAETSAGELEEEVRDRLARLYRELRSERRDNIQDRRSLLMEKWELERELDELEQAGFGDLEG